MLLAVAQLPTKCARDAEDDGMIARRRVPTLLLLLVLIAVLLMQLVIPKPDSNVHLRGRRLNAALSHMPATYFGKPWLGFDFNAGFMSEMHIFSSDKYTDANVTDEPDEPGFETKLKLRKVDILLSLFLLLWFLAVKLRELASSMLQRFGNPARSASHQPPQPAGLSTEEIPGPECLQLEWSGVKNSGPAPPKRMERLMEDAPPDKIAVVTASGMNITYAELEKRSSVVAALVAPHLHGENQRCALFMKRSADMLYGMLGILKAGAAYIPLPPSFPQDRLKYVLDDSSARAILTSTDLLPDLHFVDQLPKIDIAQGLAGSPEVGAHEPVRDNPGHSPDDAFVIFYTSGSTGRPKGVELTHRAEGTAALEHAHRFIKASDRCLQQMPFNFDVSVTEIYGTFAAHATLVLAPPDQTDMGALNRVVEHLKPDVIQMVPSVYSVYTSSFGIPRSRFFGFIGEALPVKVWKDLHSDVVPHEVLNLYGPTEVSVAATLFGPEPMLDLVMPHASVPIGKPFKWRECYVMTVEGDPQLVPFGSEGELLLAGEGLAKGYLNLPEKTAKVFVQHPFQESARAYRTGDLVRWLPSGDLLYLGRIDTQVKLHGLRIELGEIENVLREDPSVAEAAVVKHEPPQGEPCLVAYVSPSTVAVGMVLEQCRAKLAAYMVPAAVVPLDEWPRNATGKIDRPVLAARELVSPTADPGGGGAPGTGGMVLAMDSMAQMRLFSQQAMAERRRLQSLLGFCVVLMVIHHWEHGNLAIGFGFSTDLGRKVYLALVNVYGGCYLGAFVMFVAFTETTAVGLDGKSDAFRITFHELVLVILWFAWAWPLIQLQASLWEFMSWEDNLPDMLKFTGTYDYRWILLFFVFAKVVVVVATKLRIPPPAQVSALGAAYILSLAIRLDWLFPFSYIPGESIRAWLHCHPEHSYHCPKGLMSYGPQVYIFYTYIYAGTVHYGPPIMTWCSKQRALFETKRNLRVSIRLTGLICLIILALDPTYAHPIIAWLGLAVEPLKLMIMVIIVPDWSMFVYMGTHLMGTFLTELAVKRLLCFHLGVLIFGFKVLPPAQHVGHNIVHHLHNFPVAQVVAAYMTILLYALLACLVIGPFFQNFLITVVTSAVDATKLVVRKTKQCIRRDA